MDEKKMKKICLMCLKCKFIPMKKEYRKEFRRLVRCSAGHFRMVELIDLAGDGTCDEMDLELFDKENLEGISTTSYVNLGKVIPPKILTMILERVRGGRMVYLPPIERIGGIREAREAALYLETKDLSIHEAARVSGASRKTIRKSRLSMGWKT